MNKVVWVLFVTLAIIIGIYPFLFLIIDMTKEGLLASKTEDLLNNKIWNYLFYQHIICGGIALLTGWSQFSARIRIKNLKFHRAFGKIYISACLLSGLAGLYIAFYATGGWIASLGFGTLAVCWLYTTSKAYLLIRHKRINAHEDWMTRSYALTFAAVSLRICLPISQILAFDFITSYIIISWVCWIPNFLCAEWIITRRRSKSATVLN